MLTLFYFFKKERNKTNNTILEKYIELANQGLYRNQIANQLQVSEKTVSNYEKITGIKYNRRIRFPNFNYYFFDNIDQEHKAYILGFAWADGYIDKKYKTLTFHIHEKDIDVIEKIKQATNSNGIIHFAPKNTIQFNLSSIYMVNKLKEYGISPNKSKTIIFPELPDNMYSHFIRGYFDGNGCITKHQCTVVTGSLNFIKGLQNYLKNKFNRNFSFTCQSNSYRLSLYKKDKDVVNWIYKDNLIYMNRKYQCFLKYWIVRGKP